MIIILQDSRSTLTQQYPLFPAYYHICCYPPHSGTLKYHDQTPRTFPTIRPHHFPSRLHVVGGSYFFENYRWLMLSRQDFFFSFSSSTFSPFHRCPSSFSLRHPSANQVLSQRVSRLLSLFSDPTAEATCVPWVGRVFCPIQHQHQSQHPSL